MVAAQLSEDERQTHRQLGPALPWALPDTIVEEKEDDERKGKRDREGNVEEDQVDGEARKLKQVKQSEEEVEINVKAGDRVDVLWELDNEPTVSTNLRMNSHF